MLLQNLLQAVSGEPIQKVIRPVVRLVRLALLLPEELQQVEKDNEKQQLIPVSD